MADDATSKCSPVKTVDDWTQFSALEGFRVIKAEADRLVRDIAAGKPAMNRLRAIRQAQDDYLADHDGEREEAWWQMSVEAFEWMDQRIVKAIDARLNTARQRVYVWQDPEGGVPYGTAILFVAAPDLKTARAMAKSGVAQGLSCGGLAGASRAADVDRVKPDRVRKAPYGEFHQWEE